LQKIIIQKHQCACFNHQSRVCHYHGPNFFFVQTCNSLMETCSAPVGKIAVTADQNLMRKNLRPRLECGIPAFRTSHISLYLALHAEFQLNFPT
jgi:hypothetical protein